MRVLVTGCERSGTKMLADRLSQELGLIVTLENKHTIASFKYQQELDKWKSYTDDLSPVLQSQIMEKHSLNLEIDIEFLEWVKKRWPEVEIHYIVRNGLDVVSSMINKTWGHTQVRPEYNMSVTEACAQWNHVIDRTWSWAQMNSVIHRYEEYTQIVRTPLNDSQKALAMLLIEENLKLTGYAESNVHSQL